MEKQTYLTLVKGEHNLGKNNFVLGTITGIRYAVLYSDIEIDMANVGCVNGDTIIPAKCTAEEYEVFKNLVEKRYPGLCVFEHKG